jgi:hypothetical protein
MGGNFLLVSFWIPNMGSSAFKPGPGPFHGGSRTVNLGQGFPSSASTNEHCQSFNFLGGVHAPVPSVVFGGGCSCHSSHVNHPHAHASVALMLASAASLLHPFVHEDSSSTSDVSMSFWQNCLLRLLRTQWGVGFLLPILCHWARALFLQLLCMVGSLLTSPC